MPKDKELMKMKKQELFENTVKAMDNYTKAIEMDMPDFENYYNCKMKEYFAEIDSRGLNGEFEAFALVV